MSRIDSDKVNYGKSFIIQANNEPRGISSKMQHAIEENNIKALSIIETAKQEAIKIVNEARQQAEQEGLAIVEQIKKEAHEEGYQAGYNDGKNKGLNDISNEFSKKIQIFNNFVDTTFDIKKRIIKSMHMDMVKMVITIADKVCHKELDLDKNIILKITQSAINELKEKEEITIVLNPQIRSDILDILDLIKENNSLISNIKITEDSSISADGTIVESIDSRVDSRISSQIEEIANKLLSQVQTQNEDKLVQESDIIFEKLDENNKNQNSADNIQIQIEQKDEAQVNELENTTSEDISNLSGDDFIQHNEEEVSVIEKKITTPQFEEIDLNDNSIVKPVQFEDFSNVDVPQINTEPNPNENI